MKKFLALVLSMVMVIAMSTAVLAAGGNGGGGNGGGNGGGKGNGGGNGGGDSALTVVSVELGEAALEGATIEAGEVEVAVTFDRGMDENFDSNLEAIQVLMADDSEVPVEVAQGEKGVYLLTFTAAASGEYKLVIGSDVKANNGNTLGDAYEVSFQAEVTAAAGTEAPVEETEEVAETEAAAEETTAAPETEAATEAATEAPADVAQEPAGSNNGMIIGVVAVIVIAGIAFVVLRKKK